MKTKTWLPKKRPIARTLADVPSSREKPVLCWTNNGELVAPMFSDESGVWRIRSNGSLNRVDNDPEDLMLYDQPPRPTKLEDVPDLWIVYHKFGATGDLIFRDSGYWRYVESGQAIPGFSNESHWQLTDHVAELVETEIGVVE